MLRIASTTAIATVISATVALAAVLTDVAHVGSKRLGSRVALRGHIVEHIRGDYYKFEDATGSIRIEVERWARRGRTFAPATKVEISGEVSSGLFGRYIEVSRVTPLKGR